MRCWCCSRCYCWWLAVCSSFSVAHGLWLVARGCSPVASVWFMDMGPGVRRHNSLQWSSGRRNGRANFSLPPEERNHVVQFAVNKFAANIFVAEVQRKKVRLVHRGRWPQTNPRPKGAPPKGASAARRAARCKTTLLSARLLYTRLLCIRLLCAKLLGAEPAAGFRRAPLNCTLSA